MGRATVRARDACVANATLCVDGVADVSADRDRAACRDIEDHTLLHIYDTQTSLSYARIPEVRTT